MQDYCIQSYPDKSCLYLIRIVPILRDNSFPSARWKSLYRKLHRENARLSLQFVRSRNWCRTRIMNANSCRRCNSGERLETASQLQYLSVHNKTRMERRTVGTRAPRRAIQRSDQALVDKFMQIHMLDNSLIAGP